MLVEIGNSSNDFRFLNHNNSEKMRLTSDGNLGINITDP